MTGGQTSLFSNTLLPKPNTTQTTLKQTENKTNLEQNHSILFASAEELEAHNEFLIFLSKKAKQSCLWNKE
jgi:hypothetical protein